MPEEPITPEPGEPTAVTEPITPPPAAQPAAASPTTASTAAPVVTTVTRRGPWWEYLAVGLAGLVIGAVICGGLISFVSFVHHGRGDDHGRFQRFDHRGGQGPRQFGPGQRFGPAQPFGPGQPFGGPGSGGNQVTPAPTPTATG
jgi:hypothetical protein